MNTTQDPVLSPTIFEGVSRVTSRFTLVGELTDANPLGNNMSVVDGVIRDGLKIIGVPDNELDSEAARETEKALMRRYQLFHSLGLLPEDVSSPKPVQGRDVAHVTYGTIGDLLIGSRTRQSADSAIIFEPGLANVIAPADCPVYDIVDPNRYGQVAQGHAGWQGIVEGAPFVLLDEMIDRGMNPAHALVNIHPNATAGFELQGDGLEAWSVAFSGQFIDVVSGKSFIDMTAAVVWQMESRGIRLDRIQTSKVYSQDGKDLNSLTDNRFYSHRAKAQKGFNGRNAAILVRNDN